jgi:transposase
VFEDFEGELVLAHPLKNRLIAESRNKNDKVDSKVRADLLRTDFLARAWIAPKEVREERELLRYRCSLVRVQTMLKNRVRVLLAKAGRNVAASDIFGMGALNELEQMDLGGTRNLIVRGYVKVARELKAVIEAVSHVIAAYPQLAALHRRVSANQGGRKNAGRIAVARQLLVSIYHMLKRQQAFDPQRIGGRRAETGAQR